MPRRQRSAFVFGHRHHYLIDLVAGAFVVDERARTKFCNRQETGARKKTVRLFLTPPGNICRERQTGEAIPGQEAFGGEIAIGIEVGLNEVLDIGQQPSIVPAPHRVVVSRVVCRERLRE